MYSGPHSPLQEMDLKHSGSIETSGDHYPPLRLRLADWSSKLSGPMTQHDFSDRNSKISADVKGLILIEHHLIA
jgi:hypothetical protein